MASDDNVRMVMNALCGGGTACERCQARPRKAGERLYGAGRMASDDNVRMVMNALCGGGTACGRCQA